MRASRQLLPQRVLSRYLEEYLRLSMPGSPMGSILDRMRDGTTDCRGNGVASPEDRLIALADRWPGMARLTHEELRVAMAYDHPGVINPIVGEGGYVVDVEMTGVDHTLAAKLLGTTPAKAKRAYQKILNRIERCLNEKNT